MNAIEALPAAVEPVQVAPHALSGSKGLLYLLGTRRLLLASSAALSVLGSALALVPAFVVARMAPVVFSESPDGEVLRTLCAWGVAAVLARFACLSASTMAAHYAAFHILHDLRLRLVRKLGDVPLSFFAKRTSGELKRLVMDDVGQIESFVAHHFPDAVAAFSVPLVTFVALLFVDWRMALGTLVVAPIAIGVMGAAMRGMDEVHRGWLAVQDQTNSALLEYFRGIHVIKAFGLSAQRFGALARSIDAGLAWVEGYMRRSGSSFGAFSAIIGSSLVVLMPLGGWLHLSGRLSLESLTLFLVLGPQLLLGLLRLMFAFGNIQRIEEGNARLVKVLEAPSLVDSGTSTPNGFGLAFRDVGLVYGDGRTALSGVNFEARAGEVTALVGPSGAGKTSLARLVPRLWEPTTGAVELGGVRLDAQPLDALLSRVSVVFQDVFLFYGSVRDNLRLARPTATDAELEAACRAARAHDFITALPDGYDTRLGERGARLSGGEKQRLSIARALLKDAPVLVLDEATAFADAENEALIQDALAELCAGRTVLVIAHRLATIATAHRIVVLEAGRVVDQGPHSDLLERCALYQSLWREQQAAQGWTLQVGGVA